jgi:hypothetical protein
MLRKQRYLRIDNTQTVPFAALVELPVEGITGMRGMRFGRCCLNGDGGCVGLIIATVDVVGYDGNGNGHSAQHDTEYHYEIFHVGHSFVVTLF